MTESTNIAPSKGIYSAVPDKRQIAEAKPPKPSEPVSPMNTLAGFELKQRYAISDADKQKDKIDRF